MRCDATSGGGWSRGCSPAQALSPHCHALGPQGDQLPRLRPVGLRRYSAEAVLRRAQRRKLRKKLARRAVASGVSSAMPEETWEATRRLGRIFRSEPLRLTILRCALEHVSKSRARRDGSWRGASRRPGRIFRDGGRNVGRAVAPRESSAMAESTWEASRRENLPPGLWTTVAIPIMAPRPPDEIAAHRPGPSGAGRGARCGGG